ncbi:flagellar basal-body MS-ring/collar protein FliF [Vallitalea okinawensis]|uniref:flagellar basal-body MS-ring/collar protein FliF n=1 Tax=Vallitalea okinawensis TaxID=2078660 RepID=UPI000CFC6A92|nr:flagellar basal-body MS-ring/collar protein FliF [Vallitalea okinawensis]
MSEFFEKLSKQIIDYWNKFDNRQRTTIIVLGVLIIIFLSTAVYFATRPNMVTLYEGMTMEEASAITKVLQENSIAYEATDDGRTIKVEDKYQTQAKYLLADTTLPSSDYTYEDAYNSSMTDTENIKQEKLHQAMETELEQTLIRINGIEDANVILEIPDYDRLYQNNVKESKASVVLTTSKKLEQGQVNSIVGIVLNGVENLSEENITIVDHDGDTLYGGDLDQESAIVDKKFQNKVKQEDLLEKKIEELLASSYDRVTAKVNLVFDYNEYQSTKETYSNPTGDGSDTGLINSETNSSSSTTNTQTGGAPGIDSNPGEATQYATSNSGTQSESETENESADYIYNKDVTYESNSPGEIKYDNSSIAVQLINYTIYDEAILEESGQLAGTTWEDYKATITEEDFVVNDPVIASVKMQQVLIKLKSMV